MKVLFKHLKSWKVVATYQMQICLPNVMDGLAESGLWTKITFPDNDISSQCFMRALAALFTEQQYTDHAIVSHDPLEPAFLLCVNSTKIDPSFVKLALPRYF